MFYCPYTDQEWTDERGSDEHVVPLALGGSNRWRIRVEGDSNHKLGSELDGGMANDFFVAMRRSHHDARGHSGKEPWAVVKTATFGEDEVPIQVSVSRRYGLKVWNPRERRPLTRSETAGQSLQLTTHKSLDLPLRFVAKTALAAGYFAYGDAFKKHVSHEAFRAVMLDSPEARTPAVDVCCDDPLLSESPPDKSRLAVLRAGCKTCEGSVVLLVPGPERFTVAVGIVGDYVGLLSVPADTSQLPNSGDYRWGHVLASTRGFGLRGSFQRFVTKLTESQPSQSLID